MASDRAWMAAEEAYRIESDAIAHALGVLPLLVAGEFNEATKRLNTNRGPGPGTGDSN